MREKCKFKVGDRVVRIGPSNGRHYLGSKGEVVEFVKNGRVLVKWETNSVTGNSPANLELEILFNSPLYKALL